MQVPGIGVSIGTGAVLGTIAGVGASVAYRGVVHDPVGLPGDTAMSNLTLGGIAAGGAIALGGVMVSSPTVLGGIGGRLLFGSAALAAGTAAALLLGPVLVPART